MYPSLKMINTLLILLIRLNDLLVFCAKLGQKQMHSQAIMCANVNMSEGK